MGIALKHIRLLQILKMSKNNGLLNVKNICICVCTERNEDDKNKVSLTNFFYMFLFFVLSKIFYLAMDPFGAGD